MNVVQRILLYGMVIGNSVIATCSAALAILGLFGRMTDGPVTESRRFGIACAIVALTAASNVAAVFSVSPRFSSFLTSFVILLNMLMICPIIFLSMNLDVLTLLLLLLFGGSAIVHLFRFKEHRGGQRGDAKRGLGKAPVKAGGK